MLLISAAEQRLPPPLHRISPIPFLEAGPDSRVSPPCSFPLIVILFIIGFVMKYVKGSGIGHLVFLSLNPLFFLFRICISACEM